MMQQHRRHHLLGEQHAGSCIFRSRVFGQSPGMDRGSRRYTGRLQGLVTKQRRCCEESAHVARVKGPAKTYTETGVAPTSERSEGGASRMLFAEREISRSACRLHRSLLQRRFRAAFFFSTLCRTFQQGHLRGRRRDQTQCSHHQNWLRWLGTGRLGGGRLRRRTVATSMFPSSTCTSNSCSCRRSVCIDLLFQCI